MLNFSSFLHKSQGGWLLLISIASSLLFSLIIISSLKHTQLSKVQSANKVFYTFFFFPIYPCRHIFTQLEKVTRVFIFFVKNNEQIHWTPVHVNINEIICFFPPQSQIKAQHEAVSSLFSTILVQQIQSLIMIIQQWNPL